MISNSKALAALAGWLILTSATPTGTAQAPSAKKQTPPKAQPQAPPQSFYAPVYKPEKYGNQLSVNDRCIVKHGKLNTKIRPTYVNREPVGYC